MESRDTQEGKKKLKKKREIHRRKIQEDFVADWKGSVRKEKAHKDLSAQL